MAHIKILSYTPRRAGVVQSGRLLWRRKKPSWVDWCSRNLGQTGHKEWEPLQSSHSLRRILFTYIWYAQQPHYLFASSSYSRGLGLRFLFPFLHRYWKICPNFWGRWLFTMSQYILKEWKGWVHSPVFITVMSILKSSKQVYPRPRQNTYNFSLCQWLESWQLCKWC